MEKARENRDCDGRVRNCCSCHHWSPPRNCLNGRLQTVGGDGRGICRWRLHHGGSGYTTVFDSNENCGDWQKIERCP
jgi:hypothetical protein